MDTSWCRQLCEFRGNDAVLENRRTRAFLAFATSRVDFPGSVYEVALVVLGAFMCAAFIVLRGTVSREQH